MPNNINIIFEDQENHIPGNARRQNLKLQREESSSNRTVLGNKSVNNISANLNNTKKRTVLGQIDVNNVRVQPTRAAKQVRHF